MDESLIHAYLDDELDPESRLAFEEEARSDADVARQISELARLKGLLANAHRPPAPPVDLSGAIVFQLHREDARRRARQPIAASTVLALAALLMITFVLSRPAPPGNGPRLADQPEGPIRSPNPVERTTPETLIAGSGSPTGLEGAGEPGPPPVEPATWKPITLADLDVSAVVPAGQSEAQAFLIDLIDRPRSRALLIEADPGIPAESLASDLDALLLDFVRDDPRYGRLAEAGPDALFVLLAGDLERENLRARITEQLGDRCRIVDQPEPEAEPEGDLESGEGGGGAPPLLLAGSGGLVLREAERFAPLRTEPDEHEALMAARQDPHDASSTVPNPVVLPPSLRDGPTFPPGRPSPPPTGTGPSGTEPAPSPGVSTPAEVVLLRIRSAE